MNVCKLAGFLDGPPGYTGFLVCRARRAISRLRFKGIACLSCMFRVIRPVFAASRDRGRRPSWLVDLRAVARAMRPPVRAAPAVVALPRHPKWAWWWLTPTDVGLGHRAARPPRGLARRPGPRPRRRHPAEAPVPRRQRRQGRPAAVQHRPRALRGRRCAQRPGQPGARRGQRWRRPRPWPSATSRWSRPTPSASRNTPTPWPRRRQAEADVAVGRAALQTASINLGYASVTAPISGRIGRALVTEGALVGQGDATAARRGPADQPAVRELHAVGHRGAEAAPPRWPSGQFKRASGAEAASVRVVLEDGSDYAPPGKLLFSDLTVDATTGQVTLRAEVPNPKRRAAARPVRARAPRAGRRPRNAIALPQQAVTRTAAGRHASSVVGADGKVSAAHREDRLRPRATSGWCWTA